MTIVKILPEILSNQIAAGEVVQRPSSVVKELVENSIDAGSKNITIEIVRGGKSLIRVSDDGCGLLRDDALLSLERYATSKIFTKKDLFSISTMGFRGEALPSIASISKFCIVTRTDQSDIGTRIEIAGGRIRDVSDAGAPVGTMVEVKDLFFNTPARKKFLKTDNTENSHIIDTISGMALGNPDVGFRLFINSRLYKNFSSSDSLFSRSINVLGKDTADKLYKLDFKSSELKIHGFCSNPLVTRSSSSKIFLFVNRRLVYDRGVISAIFRGYQQRIMKKRYPLGVFFIDIAHDQVDVNVHPSKREIKFFNPQRIYREVSKIIADTLACEQQDIKAYSRTGLIPEARFEFLEQPLQSDSRQIKNQGIEFSPAHGESIKPDQIELDQVKFNQP
ncbi:MAG: DNA mismatch repair endonuclease MutL, partial [Desulfobacula sp.]|nr:DNA mismatch repair endonuclease MutL [Desulfobacula sp.]